MLFGCAAKPRGEKLFGFSPSYNHYEACSSKKAQNRMDDPGSVLSVFFCFRSAEKGGVNHSASAAGQSSGKLVI